MRTKDLRKKGLELRRLWPQLDELKGKLMPQAAVAAGAEGTTWYTPEMILQRGGLRSNPQVCA